jgi:PhoH-like ATPase
MHKKRKTYVLDTSVLIEDPDVFYKLCDGDIVLPTAAIKEIDGIKRNPDPDEPKAKAARKVARTLDRLGSYQDISTGAKTSIGSTVRILSRYTAIDDLASNADNRIVGAAIKLKEESDNNVILVSTDGNMRTITRAYGIRAENYPLYIGDSLSIPKERILRSRNVPPRSHIHKKPESNGKGAIIFLVIAILFILFLNAR